jgi:hypothetical protein
VTFRGKDVMTRVAIRAELLQFNDDADGPWEPAVFVAREYGYAFALLRASARVGHDVDGRLDLHLPGDGESFDIAAAVAKLWIAEVVEY